MAVANYRILWTTPNLPYSTVSSRWYDNYYVNVVDPTHGGRHASEYSLKHGDSLTFAASLEEWKTTRLNYTSVDIMASIADYSYYNPATGETRYFIAYWKTVEAQIKFYRYDYSDVNILLNPPDDQYLITSITNDLDLEQTTGQDVPITAIAYIGSGSTLNYITMDTITIHLVPNDTDFGIYINGSAESQSIVLPDNGSYKRTIEISCQNPGNTLSSGSFYYSGDDFIFDNCTITEIETTAKTAYIEVEIDTSAGVLYKEYNGTFTITGSGNSNYSNELSIKFLPDADEFIFINTPDEFLLTYSEEAVVTAELLTISGLKLKAAVHKDIIDFVDSSSNYTRSGDYYIRNSNTGDTFISVGVVHNKRQLPTSLTKDIIFTAFEEIYDASGNVTNTIDYSSTISKTVNITFDKIMMPDPITVIINQERKRIYFEFREYNTTTGTYDASVRAYEGDVYEPNMVYPAQGSDINVFTKKYKLACYGSDWQIAGIVDSSDNAINWVQTSLDDGLDYEIYKAVYSFSIWTNPNPYIIPRDGYIKLVSKKTDNGNPRATVRIKVHQEKACYEPDFTLTLVPLVETAADSNVLVDSSICSPFTLSPVYGKKYQIRVTNNCDYDILHIQSVAVEGTKPTELYYKNMFPDIDSSLDTNNTGITSSNWNIDIADIYGKLNPDTSVGSTNPYYSRKAITLLLPAMGYIPSSDPILDKYVSFKVTCYNESYGDGPDASGNYHVKTVNTDPRHLHQIGRLRSAAFEGYDYNPEVYPITPLDKLYAFSNDDIKLFDETAPTHKAFSIRTGIEILPILDSDSNQITRGVEDSSNPLWNRNQILDERCIVIAWNKLDDFLQNPVHRPRPS